MSAERILSILGGIIVLVGALFSAFMLGGAEERIKAERERLRREWEEDEDEEDDEEEKEEEEDDFSASSIYRRRAGRAPTEPLLELHPYRTYRDKIWVRCPICQGGNEKLVTCNCDRVVGPGDSYVPREVHFHMRCRYCGAIFAMESHASSLRRSNAQTPVTTTKRSNKDVN